MGEEDQMFLEGVEMVDMVEQAVRVEMEELALMDPPRAVKADRAAMVHQAGKVVREERPEKEPSCSFLVSEETMDHRAQVDQAGMEEMVAMVGMGMRVRQREALVGKVAKLAVLVGMQVVKETQARITLRRLMGEEVVARRQHLPLVKC
jgi:hypothetical protein